MPAEAEESRREGEGGALLFRQFMAMVRLSMTRSCQGKTIWTLILLAMPAILVGVVYAVTMIHTSEMAFTDPLGTTGEPRFNSTWTHEIFRMVYPGVFLHFALIFGAIMFGNGAIREEVDEQTLHYLFLQPMSRGTMMLGKYVGFILLAAPIFLAAMIITRLLLLLPYGPAGYANVLFSWELAERFTREAGVMILALAIYSAIFLALSNIFKNLFYALFIYGWEAATAFLPPALKDFSISYYLKNMLSAVSQQRTGAIAVLSDGPGPIQTVIVLTVVPVAALGFTYWLAGHKQCLYGSSTQ